MYVPSDRLLLAFEFENFRNMGLKIYELDPVKCLSAPGLAWQAVLKKYQSKLDIATDINMLLMIKKRYYRRNMPLCLLICKSW